MVRGIRSKGRRERDSRRLTLLRFFLLFTAWRSVFSRPLAHFIFPKCNPSRRLTLTAIPDSDIGEAREGALGCFFIIFGPALAPLPPSTLTFQLFAVLKLHKQIGVFVWWMEHLEI